MAPIAAALPYIVAAMSAVGGIMAADAQRDAGRAANAAAQFEAEVAENNAKTADNNARAAMLAAEEEMGQLRRQRDRLVGQNVNAVAKSGLQMSGSAWDVLEDNAMEMEYEIQSAGYKGKMQAMNFGQEAVNLRAGAAGSRFSGASALRASKKQAAGTIIGTIGSTAGAFMSAVAANKAAGVTTYGFKGGG